jgi:hypothetical protein
MESNGLFNLQSWTLQAVLMIIFNSSHAVDIKRIVNLVLTFDLCPGLAFYLKGGSPAALKAIHRRSGIDLLVGSGRIGRHT